MSTATAAQVQATNTGQMQAAPQTAETIINEQTMVCELTIRKPGVRRKVDPERISAEGADRRLISVSKAILDADELRQLAHLDGQIRAFLKRCALPSPSLRSGLHLINVARINEVDERMESFAEERTRMVATCVRLYPTWQTRARERLSGLYSENDYPSLEVFEAAFGLSHRWHPTIGVPNQLAGINREIFARERQRVREECQALVTEVRDGLRLHFHQVVNHLATCLTPGPDGRPRRFEATSVENLRDFIESFDRMDINGDTDIRNLAQRARALLSGVNAETLRRDVTVREATREGLANLAETTAQLLDNGPIRRFSAEDED